MSDPLPPFVRATTELFRELNDESEIFVLLDIRAHAQAKWGLYHLACADADKMINYAGDLATGYMRKGKVCSMFGYHVQAIDAYNQGLKYATSNLLQIDWFTTAKKASLAAVQKHVDFLALLPTEMVYYIVTGLPKKTRFACMAVSRAWRQQILGCACLWVKMSVTGTNKDVALCTMHHIASHIQDLTIDTSNEAIHREYLSSMKIFGRIRSLTLTVPKIYNINSNPIVLDGLRQAPPTLTSLNIALEGNKGMITVPELLSACKMLKTLNYSTTGPMLIKRDGMHELAPHPLTDLELDALSVIGHDLEGILQRCNQLRRLVMSACTTSVLDAVNQHAPNLEVLGYCTSYLQVPSLDQKSHPSRPGLRDLFVSRVSELDGAAPSVLLPLVYRHRFTLQRIFAHTMDITERELQTISTKFPDFKLEGLTSLAISFDTGTHEFFLNSIRGSTTLRAFNAFSVIELDEVVELLMHLPPLEKLRLTYLLFPANYAGLIHLFERYALLLAKPQELEVSFYYCPRITVNVLVALAAIKSLTRLSLCKLDSVTVQDMVDFLYKMKNNLRSIDLRDMRSVTDKTIAALADTQSRLEHILLEKLPAVTDYGLQTLICQQSKKLDSLIVVHCPRITETCLKNYSKMVVNLNYIPSYKAIEA
ncbi:hypothetical protein BJV82DRAFT_627182 [Fennellomyces sp. T-0311]|nr:hypothetical protein BJV82DRAFT_627182 [Fennellomyces sp. T-0311]